MKIKFIADVCVNFQGGKTTSPEFVRLHGVSV